MASLQNPNVYLTHFSSSGNHTARHRIVHNSSKSDVMKKIIFLALIILGLASSNAFSQNPVPEPDTLSNPVQEGDPAVRTLPPGLDYVEDDRKRIMPEELPDPVRQTLESGAEYSNWQKAAIYKDKEKEEYLVEFKEADKTTTYRFNKEGRPVLEE